MLSWVAIIVDYIETRVRKICHSQQQHEHLSNVQSTRARIHSTAQSAPKFNYYSTHLKGFVTPKGLCHLLLFSTWSAVALGGRCVRAVSYTHLTLPTKA